MPELPEVETVCRGITPHILNKKVKSVIVREKRLRWPVSAEISSLLPGLMIQSVSRRGKYLLLKTKKATVIVHLGMSGSLRVITKDLPAQKHDHIDICFANKITLRFNDPRRFGLMLWDEMPEENFLLKKLGPEPLARQFNAKFLFEKSRGRRVCIKTFIMNSHVVVGVGNIYANEALFFAGIHPNEPAGKISLERYENFVKEIKKVLRKAIKQGGTTLKDFVNEQGKPGYFAQRLQVYGRGGEACFQCDSILEEVRIGQRSSVYCPCCQGQWLEVSEFGR